MTRKPFDEKFANQIVITIAIIFMAGCGVGENKSNKVDSASSIMAPANTDGVNTTGLDTAHMDTSSGKIKK